MKKLLSVFEKFWHLLVCPILITFALLWSQHSPSFELRCIVVAMSIVAGFHLLLLPEDLNRSVRTSFLLTSMVAFVTSILSLFQIHWLVVVIGVLLAFLATVFFKNRRVTGFAFGGALLYLFALYMTSAITFIIKVNNEIPPRIAVVTKLEKNSIVFDNGQPYRTGGRHMTEGIQEGDTVSVTTYHWFLQKIEKVH